MPENPSDMFWHRLLRLAPHVDVFNNARKYEELGSFTCEDCSISHLSDAMSIGARRELLCFEYVSSIKNYLNIYYS